MRPPSPRATASAAVAAATLLLASTAPVLAQYDRDAAPVGTETVIDTMFTDAVASAVLTLVIGGLLIALAPGTTRDLTDRALDDPGIAFVYGLLSFIIVIGSFVLLAITVIGLIVGIPLLIVYVIVAVVAGELGYLAVGRLVTEDWILVLSIAVAVSAITGAVPVFGTTIEFVIVSVGVGTVILAVFETE